jgi:methylated-DNA-[protein]-cysteine S-methyltransferase
VKLWLQRMRSPIGKLLLVTDETALRALDFEDYEHRLHRLLARFCKDYDLRESQPPNDVSAPMKSYFDGNLTALDTIAVRADGTEFQRLVWTALRDIPAGTTTSYGRLAQRIGRPTAVRAVGAANGANPISIVVPCHRAIGADGHLTKYGGGLERKEWLLRHERGG